MEYTKSAIFETVSCASLENSFGTIAQKDNIHFHVEVHVDDKSNYGYFEMFEVDSEEEDWYASGGLWFKDGVLTDFDGVADLPTMVRDKLVEWGYKIDWEMEVEE